MHLDNPMYPLLTKFINVLRMIIIIGCIIVSHSKQLYAQGDLGTRQSAIGYFLQINPLSFQCYSEITLEESLHGANYYKVLYDTTFPDLPLKISHWVNQKEIETFSIQFDFERRLSKVGYWGWDAEEKKYNRRLFYLDYNEYQQVSSITCYHSEVLGLIGGIRLFYNENHQVVRIEYFDYSKQVTKYAIYNHNNKVQFYSYGNQPMHWEDWQYIYPTSNELKYYHTFIIKKRGGIDREQE